MHIITPNMCVLTVSHCRMSSHVKLAKHLEDVTNWANWDIRNTTVDLYKTRMDYKTMSKKLDEKVTTLSGGSSQN